jgi:hypothetical protein
MSPAALSDNSADMRKRRNATPPPVPCDSVDLELFSTEKSNCTPPKGTAGFSLARLQTVPQPLNKLAQIAAANCIFFTD